MPDFQVNDMTCGHCAATVEKAVKGVDASAQVKIDLGTRLVQISSDKPAVDFAAAIDEAGYTGQLQA
ncbi:heavy-metal-associated domain-containing protein [Devosia rhizoryzae]|uniref:Heavy-metal-associated domain-containing protein n=1 Tax=Devosia rhizoryzae TaxID=2774137 RepID=A0ABX7C746_9HYPH|nr:heavy-metal-associated domain-containing protein [Devosia rhizoryzae]QQR40083.1 heavy-metal-associated domain-containing protein [Devosia rhizoryzae]